jgi:hypothetical protein
MERVQVGASFTPKTEKTIGTEDFKIPAVYQTNLRGGVAVEVVEGVRTLFDIDYDRYSETTQSFNDRITYKVGLEKDLPYSTLKVGYIHVPSVFEGEYRVPSVLGDDGYFPNNNGKYALEFVGMIPYKGLYNSTEMNILTFGTSLHFGKQANLHLAYLMDMTKNVERAQFMASMDLNLSLFEKKK